MITAGVDVGAATTKAVILNEGNILSYSILPTGGDVVRAAYTVFHKSLAETGLTPKDVNGVVSTGYGRRSVPFAGKAITEIACHGKGANFLFPEARMVIDIGGQDSKVLLISEKGEIRNFVMNDKCAAGTGRFLEVMADVLDLKVEDLGIVSTRSRKPCSITSTCTVFAESEIVSLRAQKEAVEDIIAGIHQAVARRVVSMAKGIGCTDPIVFTGGVAKNAGVRTALESALNTTLIIPEEPQIVGALGAAILARHLN